MGSGSNWDTVDDHGTQATIGRGIACRGKVGHVNVNPGLLNPWLINRGVSPFSGDSSLLEVIMGRVY